MNPLSKVIVNAYEALIEIILWLSLLISVITGAMVKEFLGMFIGLGVWLIAAVLIFGTFLVIVDIRGRVERIESSLKGEIARRNQGSVSE